MYSAGGEKLFVQEKPHAGVNRGAEFAANYRIEYGAITMIPTDAGYYTPLPPGIIDSPYLYGSKECFVKQLTKRQSRTTQYLQ